jgi:hypothetical protein
MDEIFPLLGGIVLGLATSQLRGPLRWAAIALLTPLLAWTAAKISGEFEIDWRYLLFDAAEVGLVAIAVVAVIGWRRRAQRIV